MKPTLQHAVLAVSIATAPGWAAAEKWGPTWTEVTGQLYSRAQLNREPAIIKSIDSSHSLNKVVRSEPGARKVIVQSPTRKGFQGSDATLDMSLEPCKRYYINAQFKSSVGTEWEPVVSHVEAVVGCKVP